MSENQIESLLSTQEVYPILGKQSRAYTFISLNLSITNPELEKVAVSFSEALEVFIWSKLKSAKAHAAYGGYLERRGIYNRSAYFNQSIPETERNIHLGLDIWIEEGTPIYAPLDGKIHSFKNNTNHGDYGPTIILKHQVGDFEFYTLYGHLSLLSLKSITVGEKINKGQEIATLGSAEVNGDYPPHLHFQIIIDIQDYKGDYPGVSNFNDVEYYKQNCPNPNLLLKLDKNVN